MFRFVADVTWIHLVIEAPSQHAEASTRFWAAATSSSPEAGDHGLTVLRPDSGAPFLDARPTDRLRWSVSLALETDDPDGLRSHAFTSGARRAGADGLRSPADFRFDIVSSSGTHERPTPVQIEGTTSRLDQVCIDVPPGVFEAEVEFWSALTGWDIGRGGLEEFAWLFKPDHIPVRLVFQLLGDGHRGRRARAHLDLACGDDVDALIDIHERLGATPGHRGRVWHTMSDPSGLSYCLTERDQISGIIERPL